MFLSRVVHEVLFTTLNRRLQARRRLEVQGVGKRGQLPQRSSTVGRERSEEGLVLVPHRKLLRRVLELVDRGNETLPGTRSGLEGAEAPSGLVVRPEHLVEHASDLAGVAVAVVVVGVGKSGASEAAIVVVMIVVMVCGSGGTYLELIKPWITCLASLPSPLSTRRTWSERASLYQREAPL